MNKKQLEKNIDNMSWTYDIENFINNLSRADAKKILKFFNQNITKFINDFNKITSDKDTCYDHMVSKIISDLVIFFHISNKEISGKITPPVICFTIRNKGENTGGLETESDIVQFDIFFQVVTILLERHIKMTRNKNYVKGAEEIKEDEVKEE